MAATSASCDTSRQIIFVGVHDHQRHIIASDEALHRYPDDTLWAFARCHQAAAEAPEGGDAAARKRPMCEECASLKAEEPAS